MEVLLKPKGTLRISGLTGHLYKAWTGSESCSRLRLPVFLDNRHMKVAKVVSPTHQPPLPQGTPLVLIPGEKNTTGLCNNVPPVQQ